MDPSRNLKSPFPHHGSALNLAHRLIHGEPIEAFQEFLRLWPAELAPMLAEDERLLVPLATERCAARLQRQQDGIAMYADPLRRGTMNATRVRVLGWRLRDYAEWLEQELYPLLEIIATPAQLEALSRRDSAGGPNS